jgi:hypothetical protein
MPKHSGSHKSQKKSDSIRSHDQKPNRVKRSGRVSGKRQKSQGIDLPKITPSKKGCGTKLLTLLLPIVTFGAYLILKS